MPTGAVVACLAGVAFAATLSAQTKTGKPYVPPPTAWGDPEIAGVYTNSDESLTPFERPAAFEGRRLSDFTEAELEQLREERSDTRNEADRNRAEFRSPIHWFENHFPQNSRAWLVVDPPDGHIPALTPEGRQRAEALAAQAATRGPADSFEDRSLWDQCITRGLPRVDDAGQYGNAYQIVQGPGYVAIIYEMVHETRVIPLDGVRTPAPGSACTWRRARPVGRQHAGRRDDEFHGPDAVPRSSEHLKMIERFTPIAPGIVEWSATFDDPHTWVRPWTFAMNLTRKDDSQRPFEYACHEGNYGMVGILRGARAEEQAGRVAVSPREAEGER